MFLSDATVLMFTFTILLNFLYLYSPIESIETGILYKTCEECLKTACHIQKKRPCNTRLLADYKFICFECPPEFGNEQFYSEDDCLKGCTDPSYHCVCDFSCFMCVQKEGFDKANFTECNIDPNEEITCV
ncbi:uncharacterized protein LOC132951714 [Metopolophium dirhodum]|uniref:uncharacterized protein LOC132951714 n=1 Tax=Metopolophium dirhodum TaxID=44670 RepID=UPI00298F834B|nr:uncharacterized protein LOC132951714 [Metopolophium dirhodum]